MMDVAAKMIRESCVRFATLFALAIAITLLFAPSAFAAEADDSSDGKDDSTSSVVDESGVDSDDENDSDTDTTVAQPQTIEELATSNTGAVTDGHVYVITSDIDKSKALDVSGGSSDSGANVQIYESNNTAAQQWTVTYDENGYATLVNAGSDKALDVSGAVAESGTNVQQYSSNATKAQQWVLVKDDTDSDNVVYTIVSALSIDMVLDVSGGSSANGTNVQIYASNGTPAQRWHFFDLTAARDKLNTDAANNTSSESKLDEGVYVITSAVDGGYALDVSSGSSANGANVQVYASNYTGAQRWSVAYGSDGFATITNVKSQKALDVAGGKASSGTNVQQYSGNDTDAQKWFISKNDDGTYTLYSAVYPDMVLDLSSGKAANGQNVWLYASNATKAQKWVFTLMTAVVDDGAYVITSALKDDLVVDVASGSANDGAALQVYSANGTLAQTFALVYDKATSYYTIVNYGSGCVADVPSASSTSGTGLQQYISNGTYAQKWQIIKNGTGEDATYTFISANSGLAMDVRNAATTNGTRVQQYTANGTKAQQFKLAATTPTVNSGVVTLRNAANVHLVADVKGGDTTTSGVMQLYESNGTFAQKFMFTKGDDGTYVVQAINSGLYLNMDAEGAVSLDEASTTTWSVSPNKAGYYDIVATSVYLGVSGSVAQESLLAGVAASTLSAMWTLLSVSLVDTGYYIIESSANTSYVLDIYGGTMANGTNVQLYESNDTNAQKFYVRSNSDGTYTILNAYRSKAIDVDCGTAAAGTNIQIYTANGTDAQKWTVEWNGKGGFIFKSALGEFAMGTATTATVGNSTNVALQAYNEDDAYQTFVLVPTTFTYLTFDERIAMLESIDGWGLQVFGTGQTLSQSVLDSIYSAMQTYFNMGLDVSFVMMDLYTGAGVSYNADKRWSSQCTIKGPYVIAMNKYWNISDDSYWAGVEYPAIHDSENSTYKEMRSTLGSDPLAWLVAETHADIDAYATWPKISARELCKLWVGCADYLMNYTGSAADYSRYLFSTNNAITSRPWLAWKNCTVYAKSGWTIPGDHHEGYLVMDGDHPYICAVFTSVPGDDDGPRMGALMNALDQAHSDMLGL